MSKKVLVLCTGNSCRSQIAEGYLRKFLNIKGEVFSAGVETHGVNPMAIKTMMDDGVDISNHTSNHIDEYQDLEFDFIITVCDHAKEKCPYFPSQALRIHKNFFDPSKVKGSAKEINQAFEIARNEIKDFCENFVQDYFTD